MSLLSRATRSTSLILPILLLAASPAPASARAPMPQAFAGDTSALPPLPSQADPWLYRGSDIPRDKEWVFGSLPNGLRWAARANGVPPGQVSIRIRMNVGSLFEQPSEAGFAHLLEHLVFRQSKYLGDGQAIPTWQRLGATFGSDTNAETSATHTVFKIDLPDASPATLDESFKLLSGMMIAPTLSEANVRSDAAIVLAEKRERGGTAERMMDAVRQMIYFGQPMADHSTIGSVATIEGARAGAVQAFHQRWYRPENAVIIVSGDADPRLMAALVGKWFGDWQGRGPVVAAPNFGEPAVPPGSDPANPVGYTRVLVEPGQPRSISFAVVRPWREKIDTVVYNQGLMIDQVAQAIINRRLEAKARSGARFLSAQLNQQNESRSVDATYVSVIPLDSDWRGALADARGVIADALASPPTTEEIAREVAEINVIFESMVQQRALAPGGKLADDLVQAVDIHETVAAPEVVLDIFRKSIPLFSPQAVLIHARSLMAGRAVRALYVTPQEGEADAASLKLAMLARPAIDRGARLAAKTLSFAELPPIGAPAPAPDVVPTGLLRIEQLGFANGVKVQLWPTRDDPGRVTVKVRFGAGYRSIRPQDNGYALLGSMALVGSGQGSLGQEELDRITTGRKMGFEFRIDEAFFQFSADTRAEDLDDQLYLFAGKFAQPRWDTGPVMRARAAARLQYDSLAASPQGVLERDLKQLQRGGDARFAMPTPTQLASITPEGFRQMWAPILASGPVEVQVFGDFNRSKAIAALQRTFGALPARLPLPEHTAPATLGFAQPTPQPVVLRHGGDANQAAVVVSWPTGGGLAGLKQARHLEILAQLFSNRLLDAMRERAGASYAPQVGSDWPLDLASGGTITAMAQLQPEMAGQFFATVDAIVDDLAARPASADELARVIEPLRQQVSRASTSTAFFMMQVEGATQEPARYNSVRSLLGDYTEVTPQILQELAGRYLGKAAAWRLAVLPQTAPKVATGR